MKSIVAFTFLFSSSCVAFSPGSFGESTTSSRRNSALHVSVVRDLINKKVPAAGSSTPKNDEAFLLWESFETQTPESVGMKGPGIQSSSSIREQSIITKVKRKTNSRKRRKHNFREQTHLQEKPDLDFLTLHSSAVSHLQRDTPVNDIVYVFLLSS
jgi:hypothetical protein